MFPVIPLQGQPMMPGFDLTQMGPMMMPPAQGMPQPMMPPAQSVPMPMPGVGAPPPAPAMSPWQRLAAAFQDPANQLGLLQTGLQLMQPVQPGQSTAGHVAQAIGSGVTATGQVKEKNRKAKLEERIVGQTDKRIALDEQRVGLEGQRVEDALQNSRVSREAQLQTIEQNKKKFPLTIKELEGKIEKMVADGKLTAEQTEYWKEKARLYPEEVRADLMRAQASVTSAGKPTGAEAMFTATAAAEAKRQGLQPGTPEYEQAYNTTLSELGKNYFGKSTSSATVRTVEEYMEGWKQENPKKPGESDAAYETRMGQAKTTFMTTKKKGNYNEALTKFLGENAMFIRTPEDEAKYKKLFDSGWNSQEPGKGAPAPAGGAKRSSVSRAEVKAAAASKGVSEAALEAALKKQGVTIVEGTPNPRERN